MRAAVVGAGLAGLTAAYRLQQGGWEVEVFEAEDRPGGRVQTVREDGYQFDTAASAAGASYGSYLELARELGIELSPCSPHVAIYRRGRLHHLRLDRLVRSGLTTRLLPLRSKLRCARLGFDVVRAVRAGQLDYADMRRAAPLDTESARDYVLRRLDDEVNAALADPIVRTMLIADSDKVSRVELFSGLANIFSSLVLAADGGQGRLPEALAERVPVRLSHPVSSVVEGEQDVAVDGTSFDAAVVACPLPVARAICPGQAKLLGPLDDALDYTSCITVAVGTTVPPPSPAFLVQLSSRDDPDVALMFLEHNKGPGRAPDGHGLIGACWETAASSAWMERDDEEIVAHTVRSVCRVFPQLEGKVDFAHVTRWPRALPWTRIGSYKLIGDFNAALDPAARVQFAGDYMSAAGQHTAVNFGTRAAANLLAAHS